VRCVRSKSYENDDVAGHGSEEDVQQERFTSPRPNSQHSVYPLPLPKARRHQSVENGVVRSACPKRPTSRLVNSRSIDRFPTKAVVAAWPLGGIVGAGFPGATGATGGGNVPERRYYNTFPYSRVPGSGNL